MGQNEASTGPRCFQRGMRPDAWAIDVRCDVLQRGRVVSNAECPLTGVVVGSCSRFNGAALFPTRNAATRSPALNAFCALQRGRVVSNAECKTVVDTTLTGIPASTGPRCFQRGMDAQCT